MKPVLGMMRDANALKVLISALNTGWFKLMQPEHGDHTHHHGGSQVVRAELDASGLTLYAESSRVWLQGTDYRAPISSIALDPEAEAPLLTLGVLILHSESAKPLRLGLASADAPRTYPFRLAVALETALLQDACRHASINITPMNEQVVTGHDVPRTGGEFILRLRAAPPLHVKVEMIDGRPKFTVNGHEIPLAAQLP